jgi:hypothetical protein
MQIKMLLLFNLVVSKSIILTGISSFWTDGAFGAGPKSKLLQFTRSGGKDGCF